MGNKELEDAVGKASEELGISEESVEVEASNEDSTSEGSGDDAGKTETPEATEDGEESPDPEAANDSDSVQPIADASAKRAIGDAAKTHGRPQAAEGSPDGGAKKSLAQQLLDELRKDGTGKPKSGVRDISEVDLQNPRDVQAWLDERVMDAITRVVAPMQHANAVREADLELKKLMQDHPDAHKHGKAMAALIEKNPQLPLEYAYRIAAFDSNKAAGKQEAIKSMDKKKTANLAQSTAKKPPETASTPKNPREAVLKAMDELGA